ncbi:MAG: outer membrane beta-barrel protein [Blastocatellales bacterium]
MRKLFLIAALAIALPLMAQAQDSPETEIFGGYSYLRGDDSNDGIDLHGWNASFNQNIVKWAGIKADFSGHYGDFEFLPGFGSDLSAHLFLIGPQFSIRKNERVQPFVHALFGVMRTDLSFFDVTGKITQRDSTFAMALGGGLDVKLTDHLAVRLFQADYVLTRFDDDSQHNFRASTGLVLRLGEKD